MKLFLHKIICLASALFAAVSIFANIPGGGTGTGANVTLVDNGSTVTIGNGIVSILCTKSGATINQINYTYNNGGGAQTLNLLAGGHNGGQLYWETGGFGSGTFTYSLVTNPANNGGNYAEIKLLSSSTSSGTMEVHFSMLRGSPGFYVTAIWSHRSSDAAMSMGETRDNIYAGSIFNWMSVDATRNRLMEVQPGAAAVSVLGAPVEVSLWTNGIYQGQYEDKYKYSADFGAQRAWGWSSVGAGGKNVGLWNISASVEYYNGGPMKRELMEHIGTTILNMTRGSHYGGGTDSSWASGEVWTHVYGPYFIYCNNTTNVNQAAAQALYNDALAQAAAEQTAWPYDWFTNINYAPASNRGVITGTIAINDLYNPNASASNLWVGVVQQPLTTDNVYDFQEWMKPYQFWVKTDANGKFIIPNVIAGTNYTLYAFGPGAAGTFISQPQSGGNPPISVNIPSPSFNINVNGGVTNNLGTITWTPTRVGPTVFEIGYPDRTGGKFRHGEDWWVGDIGPGPTNPNPIWSKFLEYPFDFPNGPNYIVGQSRWTTDWNFVQPCVVDSRGIYNDSSSTITFNISSAPSGTGSFYIALSSDYQGALEIAVNGTQIAGSSGYTPAYSSSSHESDSTIREGIHGLFSDNRINFAATLLHQGQNTITIYMRQTGKVNGDGYFADHAMYDYIRLELTGYVPPPPASVAAYAGNNRNLISWPVVSGATSYNLLRSTTSNGDYISLDNNIIGPVCGSGENGATYLDTNAANGMTYYYIIQSVNPVGVSGNSPASGGVTPSLSMSATSPAIPVNLTVSSIGHHAATLFWDVSPGASFYTIQRSTLVNSGGGTSNTLVTITLANNITGTSYTDTSPTDGSIYSYTVIATSAGGISDNSAPVVAVPLPPSPANPPDNLKIAASSGQTNYVISWSPVTGAVGYVIRRATNSNGPFTFLASVTETTYTDSGLNANTEYYYTVTAVNAGGVSGSSAVAAPGDLPIINTASVVNDNLNLTGSGGLANWTYYVLATTNLATMQWTRLVTNHFDGIGNFSMTLTNAVPSWPQTFFKLQLQ